MFLNTKSSGRLLTIKDIFLRILSFSKVYTISSFNILFEFYTRTVGSGGVEGGGGSAGNKKEGD